MILPFWDMMEEINFVKSSIENKAWENVEHKYSVISTGGMLSCNALWQAFLGLEGDKLKTRYRNGSREDV